MRSPLDVLQEYWQYPAFRPQQEDIISSVLSGKDTLAIMPTGGGKSLCYQIPAMANKGLCLVVSPLIALMKDQVDALQRRSITAFAIYAGMSRKDIETCLKAAIHSNCKFLYVSPERIQTDLFKEYLPALPINLIAVDEAHCISQWGYDFRPAYLQIATIRSSFPHIPVLALTASATPLVQDDICAKLALPEQETTTWSRFHLPFERPNLHYRVLYTASKTHQLLELLNTIKGTAIIYCKSRKRTKDISEWINQQGFVSTFYHAGLSQELRNERQQQWIKSRIAIMVCTNAFGMGIDKPDVRLVVHIDTPDCLESYYQEAGRAGRDGEASYAVLLYNDNDAEQLTLLPAVRFPPVTALQQLYQSVANYLQLPAGTEAGISFDFDYKTFTQKFKLDSMTTIYGLKALEQEGWINLTEDVFLPSKVIFICNRYALQQLEEEDTALDDVAKTLLRTYEGIFDYPVFIAEGYIAYLLNTEQTLITQQLTKLDALGIISYEPRKDKPQLSLLRTRIAASELYINEETYTKRKKQLEDRIEVMLNYSCTLTKCRSVYIGQYFGDTHIQDCKVCDNCRDRKKQPVGAVSLSELYHKLKQLTIQEHIPVQKIYTSYEKHYTKESIRTFLHQLYQEGKLTYTPEGAVRVL